MASDILTDTGTKAEIELPGRKFSELSIHVVFHNLPVVAYPNDSEPEQPVKYGPPFLRFPVNLTTEDATVLENIFDSGDIALIGFEIKDSDGNTRKYVSVTTRH